MDKIEFVNKEFENLLNNGSDISDLESIKPVIINTLEHINDENPESIIKELSSEIIEESKKFLSERNDMCENYLDGLSTCIYLPDVKTGGYKIKFLGGKNTNNSDVDKDTKFDIASITKMYTLLLTFKLVEHGYFNLNDRISKLDHRFSGLEDFTINDLLKLCGELYTNGNIKEGKTVEEANQILETVYLKDNDRTRNLYTDLGMIVLSKVIEKTISEKEGKNVTFDEIMNKYIFESFNLKNTTFNPINYNLAGNGNSLGLVHDPKARALGGAVGSAGIFTTSDDLALLAREMFTVNNVNYNYLLNLVSPLNLQKMGTITFPDSKQNNKGLVGLYQKNPDRENKWLNPLIYGDNSFTAQGFTGSVATFDPKNNIHNSYLVSSIKDGAPKKPDGFMEAFKRYEYFIVSKTMELYMIKKYYDLVLDNNNFQKEYRIK